jgi:hypothetical protein
MNKMTTKNGAAPGKKSEGATNHSRAGWVEKRLGDVVKRLTNGYVGPTRNIYLESGVPLNFPYFSSAMLYGSGLRRVPDLSCILDRKRVIRLRFRFRDGGR